MKAAACHVLHTVTDYVVAQLYTVALKRGLKGTVYYGRQTYDFHEGLLTFLAPGQVVQADARLDVSDMTDKQTATLPILLLGTDRYSVY